MNQGTGTQDVWASRVRWIHWLMALLMIGMMVGGFVMADMPKDDPLKYPMYDFHKATGMVLLFLIVVRIVIRLTVKAPAYPKSMPRWQCLVAHALHGILYLLMIALPVSGYLMSTYAGYPVSFYGLFDFPMLVNENDEAFEVFHDGHEIFGAVVAALVILHALAALKHHVVDKDDILKRMLGR